MLNNNNHVLSITADLEEKFYSKYLFDTHYLNNISEGILKIVQNLNALTNDKYPAAEGFAITSYSFIQFLSYNNLEEMVKAIDSAFNTLCKKIHRNYNATVESSGIHENFHFCCKI